MREFNNVREVRCKEDVCWIEHGQAESEVEVGGVMLSGRNSIVGETTESKFEDGKCKVYDDVLICKEEKRW